MGHYNIRVWHPVDELAVVEQALLCLLLDAVQVELLPLVSEEELGATWVQLKVVDLRVVGDCALHLSLTQVLDTDSHLVEKVRDDLSGLTAISLLLGVVEPG